MTKNPSSFPVQTGKTAIVTGTGGLGFQTAKALAALGAHVVLAGRNAQKGAESLGQIKAAQPDARIEFAELDLASLASVRAFSDRIANEHAALDLLINNAGVMSPPIRKTTSDGFELQLGTNYLGHFALTAHLLPLLRRAPAPRVVQLSSLAARGAAIQFADLQFERRYSPWASYGQSKLAMLMFAFELQRQSDAHGWHLLSAAAHPGYARTELIPNGPGAASALSRLTQLLQPWVSQSATEGAEPTLFAAVSPTAEPAAYYGPNGFYELKGSPKRAFVPKKARDLELAHRLWSASEELTQVRFGR